VGAFFVLSYSGDYLFSSAETLMFNDYFLGSFYPPTNYFEFFFGFLVFIGEQD